MKRKTINTFKIYACCISLLLFNFWTPCWAQNPDIQGREEARGPRHREGREDDILKELNLTTEQQTKLSAYQKQSQAEKKEVFSGLKNAMTGLMQELEKPDSNPKEIERLSKEVKKYQGKLHDLHVSSITNIKKVLTPEQYKNFHEKAKERHKHHDEQKPRFD